MCRNLDAEREVLCVLQWPSAGMASSCHIKQFQLENGWGMRCSEGDCALQDLSSSSRRPDDLPMWNAEQPQPHMPTCMQFPTRTAVGAAATSCCCS